MPNVEDLEKERVRKFEAICALIADALGFGELDTLGESDRALVKAEADEATERWMENADAATPPQTNLQKLLAEHFELMGKFWTCSPTKNQRNETIFMRTETA